MKTKKVFSQAEVETAKKKFANDKVRGKTERVKAEELESLLLYGVSHDVSKTAN